MDGRHRYALMQKYRCLIIIQLHAFMLRIPDIRAFSRHTYLKAYSFTLEHDEPRRRRTIFHNMRVVYHKTYNR